MGLLKTNVLDKLVFFGGENMVLGISVIGHLPFCDEAQTREIRGNKVTHRLQTATRPLISR